MCTAITCGGKEKYFGRNLDMECSYGEKIVITPRNFPFDFKHKGVMKNHYAIIGVAGVKDGYPLYYDAANEKGLAIAGLNFPGNAVYNDITDDKDNIASFEVVTWILSQCQNVSEARILLAKMNITGEDFSKDLPDTPLHWIVADGQKCIVVEQTKNGLRVYDNPIGVLTNNPGFDYHLENLNNYMRIGVKNSDNHFSDKIKLRPYSRGMGAIGLPGDLSSASRFVRAAFVKFNSVCDDEKHSGLRMFFRILESVDQQKGCVVTENGDLEYTVYSNCYNLEKGIIYWTTYLNRSIWAMDMNHTDLDKETLDIFEMYVEENVHFVN